MQVIRTARRTFSESRISCAGAWVGAPALSCLLCLRNRGNLPLHRATERVPRETTMRRHPTRDFLRQVLTGELGDDELDEVQEHIEEGCVTCLLTDAGADGSERARPAGQPGALHRSGLPEHERDEGYERAVRQTAVRAISSKTSGALGPTLLAELDRRPTGAAPRGDPQRRPAISSSASPSYLAEESRRAGFHDVARAVGARRAGRRGRGRPRPELLLPFDGLRPPGPQPRLPRQRPPRRLRPLRRRTRLPGRPLPPGARHRGASWSAATS